MCLALGGNSAPAHQQQQPNSNPGPGGTDGTMINLNAAYSPDDSRNPLHFAAILGDLASLQLLIWHGADVNATDSYGLTAWSYAHVCHQTPCTRLLQMNGCHTVSPLGVPADWLQLMRMPFPLTSQSNSITGNLTGEISAGPDRLGFHSSDSGSPSCSSSSSSAVASESDADDAAQPDENAIIRHPPQKNYIIRNHSKPKAANLRFSHRHPPLQSLSVSQPYSWKSDTVINQILLKRTAPQEEIQLKPHANKLQNVGSNAFVQITGAIQERTNQLLNEAIRCRALSNHTSKQLSERLKMAQSEASRFTKRVSSLSSKVEERSQVNKRFRAKVKALLAVMEKIQASLDSLSQETTD
ncbi:unnamed protein product [Echinostoma caproni]|uniref:ANK_REP_REGION domain-containing protein n=1 Tax=Echinostoma caproni TaxID=27848 RepID=A0A183ARK3_9TREM|nr:unnamed protein product [Echinostoma caproni]